MEFTLRSWQETDAASVYKYANNEKVAANLRNKFPFPYLRSDAEEYVLACAEQGEDRQVTRAIVVGGEAVGSIGVFFESDVSEKNAELGYWLGEPFWGNGIMCRAVKEICAYVFDHYDITRIYAAPFAYNEGSCRTLEKAGFAFEGVLRKSVYKIGVYHDSRMYALIKE